MRKSDAFYIIKSCIKLNHGNDAAQYQLGEISLGRFSELCAETILSRLEAEGFLPPGYAKYYGAAPTDFVFVNEWEPEKDLTEAEKHGVMGSWDDDRNSGAV